VEWSREAAVEVDQPYLTYAHWCVSHGKLVLEAAQVVAALQAHRATLHTRPLTQTTTVLGVRVVA
jgi:hypothetical protein